MIASSINQSPERGESIETRGRLIKRILEAACLVGATCSSLFAQHNTDLWIGVSGGSVAWQPDGGLEPGSVYHPLDPVDSFLHGWSENDPGFDHNTVASGGIGVLPSGAEIWLEVLSLDRTLFVIDNAFEVLEFPGDATFLGEEDVHTHLTWFVDLDDPRFDPEQCVWEGTFKLTDEGGGLGDSASFTLLFANVPVRGGGFPPNPELATGDFDDDQDIDLDDAKALSVCTNGPGVRPTPSDPDVTTCEVDCHNAFDFDDDLDIDLLDFAEFQVIFGSNG